MNTLTVTVYTKPNCVQCDATKRKLRDIGAPFEEVDIMADPNTLAAAKALGHLSAPVVLVSNGVPGDEIDWSGYKPELIDLHIAKAAR